MRLLRLGIIGLALSLCAVVLSALWFGRAGQAVPQGDVILVFGAGMSPEGHLDTASRLRVERGVALWSAGAAPRIVFSGGPAVAGGPVAGAQMAVLAQAAGVPEAAILIEGQSQSTLQNTYFTALLLQETPDAQVIAVSEGFHLARCLVAMKWAGLEVAGAAASTRFRGGFAPGARMVVREVAAWGFNLARIVGFEAAGLIGVQEETRVRYLR